MKHENEPEGLPVCNFCEKEYDPHDIHTCAGNSVPARMPSAPFVAKAYPEMCAWTMPEPSSYLPMPGLTRQQIGEALDAERRRLAEHAAAGTLTLEETHRHRELEMPLDKFADTVRVPGYESLEAVLFDAYLQAATGKGAARHGRGISFDEQPTQAISTLLGTDAGLAFQAMKKINEGMRLEPAAKVKELLGAINYIASIVIHMGKSNGR